MGCLEGDRVDNQTHRGREMSTYYNQDLLLEMENKITKLEEENRQLKASQRWIPVNERLPQDEEIVLSYNQSTGVNMAAYSIDCGTNGFKLLHWNVQSGVWYPYITHWQLLPNPPTSEKGEK